MKKKMSIWKMAFVIVALIIFLSALVAYSQYVALKNAFISRLSQKSSALAGQKVTIADFSFGQSARIDIHDIVVENPEGFAAGHLLKVKMVSIQMNFPELLRGRISIKSVDLTAPELYLIRDGNGRINISHKLREFLTRKSTIKYQIDTLRIRSGVFDLNRDGLYHIKDIDVALQPLSSYAGTKTSVEATAATFDGGKFSVKGWAYLKDDPGRIDISALWRDVRLSFLEELAGKKVSGDIHSGKVEIDLHAVGDTRDGIALKSGMRVKEARTPFLKGDRGDIAANVDAILNPGADSLTINNAEIRAGGPTSILLKGVVKGIKGTPSYDAKVQLSLPDLSMFNIGGGYKVAGSLTSDPIIVRGRFDRSSPSISGVLHLSKVSAEYGGVNAGCAEASISFNCSVGGLDSLRGSTAVRAGKLSVMRTEGNKTLVKDVEIRADMAFRGRDLDMKAKARAGKVSATVSGTVNGFAGDGRLVKVKVVLPETKIDDIRGALWDVFPDNLLYVGLMGSVAADFSAEYDKSVMVANGQMRIMSFSMEGENGEYSIGPVDGTIPLVYMKGKTVGPPPSLPSFERSDFDRLRRYYSSMRPEPGSNRITVGSLRYGFRLLDDIEVWIRQEGNYLNISRFDANIFDGRLDGSAVVDISDHFNYRAGMLVKGISLTKLCEDVTPIKGYISGKVDGVALLKGTGAGMDALIGRADFWSYSAGSEKTKISREFLQKMGGPQMKAYIGDRPFDTGMLSLYLQNGFLIFKEFDISHRNFLGIRDLSVKVAPFSNRIALDHLMSTIAEAADRAKKK